MRGRKGSGANDLVQPGHMFERLQTSAGSAYSNENLPVWISKHTRLAGEPYSFVGHEYQLKILSSKKRIQYTKKCSQLGISELKIRRALATAYMIPHMSVMLTMPTTGMASNFAKTRIDPIIADSETLKSALDANKDSTELKGIGTSHLYVRGTFSDTAAISVPVDFLLVDEVDFSNPDVLDKFESRFTHSKYKWRMETSTPTLPGFGIDERMQSSNRHHQLVRCCHCNHYFIPDYTKDVVVPGYNGDILELDKPKLHRTRWQEAYLKCPKCGKKPDLSLKYREWVVENPSESHVADGFQLTPFDGAAFITVQDLMQARTTYKRIVDFVNFSLGLCREDALSGIQEADLDLMEAVYTGELHASVLGIDMGSTCTIAECTIDGGRRLEKKRVHQVDYRSLTEYLRNLNKEVKPIAMVMDALPYTETVYRLQLEFPHLYAALYVNSNSVSPFRFIDKEEDKLEGLLDDRQINVNRDVAFDQLMEDIRAQFVGINPYMDEADLAVVRKQLRDMKRVRCEPVKSQPDNERFRWVKSKDGDDHSHHAILYAWIAAKIRLAARPQMYLPSLTQVMKFRQKVSL